MQGQAVMSHSPNVEVSMRSVPYAVAALAFWSTRSSSHSDSLLPSDSLRLYLGS
eukprot:COSAG01_NODE_48599_length_379_cov_2.182143_2_plen_53_part_01